MKNNMIKTIIGIVISVVCVLVGLITIWQTNDSEIFCLGLIATVMPIALLMIISDKE